MSESILQRRLVDVAERLKRLRAELAVADEQVLFLDEEAEDARLRALVAETPLGEVEARDARRHADTLRRHRDALSGSIEELRRDQDALLDRMTAEAATRTDRAGTDDVNDKNNDTNTDQEATTR